MAFLGAFMNYYALSDKAISLELGARIKSLEGGGEPLE